MDHVPRERQDIDRLQLGSNTDLCNVGFDPEPHGDLLSDKPLLSLKVPPTAIDAPDFACFDNRCRLHSAVGRDAKTTDVHLRICDV